MTNKEKQYLEEFKSLCKEYHMFLISDWGDSIALICEEHMQGRDGLLDGKSWEKFIEHYISRIEEESRNNNFL